MKKSTTIMSVLLALTMGLSIFGMTACTKPDEKKPNPDDNPNPPVEHTHTFSDTWESNETQHWHAATCEHTTEKKDVGNHDSKGENGSCSVCGRAHQHTFAEEWTVDTDYHWHDATCIHFEEIDGKARHDTKGANGSCSVCGYAPHAHTFASEWSTNGLAHWKACTCSGEGEEQHKYRFASESAFHDYDANFKCKVCGYQHTHPIYEYKAVDSKGHWDVYDCIHRDFNNKLNYQAHDTAGAHGSCSVCGWQPLVEKATENNKHTHTVKWEWSPNNHWRKATCNLNKVDNYRSCDKGVCVEFPKQFDMGPHTYGADGKCTVCGFSKYSWRYGTDDCIKCDVCGGCIKTVCVHEGEATHKKCGDQFGADAQRFTLEAEEGEVWSREAGNYAGIADYSGGKRDCIHASYANVGWTFYCDRATTVTLRISCGRTKDVFDDQTAVWINGVKATTNTPCAQPSGEDSKCNPGWLTFGCIELKEGTNRLEVLSIGENGFHLDKVELITYKNVVFDYTPINNTWLYEIGQYTPIPRKES